MPLKGLLISLFISLFAVKESLLILLFAMNIAIATAICYFTVHTCLGILGREKPSLLHCCHLGDILGPSGRRKVSFWWSLLVNLFCTGLRTEGLPKWQKEHRLSRAKSSTYTFGPFLSLVSFWAFVLSKGILLHWALCLLYVRPWSQDRNPYINP